VTLNTSHTAVTYYYAVRIVCGKRITNGPVSVRPSVSSIDSIAAAAGGFAAEVGRRSIYSCCCRATCGPCKFSSDWSNILVYESVLSTINLRTKLEMFSFAHSKDMKGAQNIYTRLVTTTTSILEVVCHLKPNTSYGLSPSKI